MFLKKSTTKAFGETATSIFDSLLTHLDHEDAYTVGKSAIFTDKSSLKFSPLTITVHGLLHASPMLPVQEDTAIFALYMVEYLELHFFKAAKDFYPIYLEYNDPKAKSYTAIEVDSNGQAICINTRDQKHILDTINTWSITAKQYFRF